MAKSHITDLDLSEMEDFLKYSSFTFKKPNQVTYLKTTWGSFQFNDI